MDPLLFRANSESCGIDGSNFIASPHVNTSAFGRAAQRAKYDKAATGNAGTGRPIPTIYGAPKDRAIRAKIGGGPEANGGGGIVQGDKNLHRTGVRAEVGADIAISLATEALEKVLDIGIRYVSLRIQDRKTRRDGEPSTESELNAPQ